MINLRKTNSFLKLHCLASGFPGIFLAILMICSYFFLGCFPFDWKPRKEISNRVTLAEDGSLNFFDTGLALARNSKGLTQQIHDDGIFELRLVIVPSPNPKHRTGTVFCSSDSPYRKNVAISQFEDDLIVELRNGLAETPENFTIYNCFNQHAEYELNLRTRASCLSLSVNEQLLVEKVLDRCPLKTWDPEFSIAIGNTASGERPWRGKVLQCELVFGNGSTADLTATENIEIPDRYYFGYDKFSQFFSPIRLGSRVHLIDALLNFACFLPLGYLIIGSFFYRCWLRSFVFCSALSLAVELTQIGLDGRFPAFSDLALNSLGALAGIWIWCLVDKSTESSV